MSNCVTCGEVIVRPGDPHHITGRLLKALCGEKNFSFPGPLSARQVGLLTGSPWSSMRAPKDRQICLSSPLREERRSGSLINHLMTTCLLILATAVGLISAVCARAVSRSGEC